MKDILSRSISEIAEELEPIEGVGLSGRSYKFLKYRWNKSFGLMDAEGKEILIRATPNHKKLYVRFDLEAIILGNESTGWEAYSMDCKHLWPGNTPFSKLQHLLNKLKGRAKYWLPEK